MRVFVAFALAAPLALLAACGESTPADEMDAAPMETVLATEAAEPEPIAALDLSEADFAGEYTMLEQGGTRETLVLNPDGTYEYMTSDGLTRTGDYVVMTDNRRLMIEDFDGRAAYFSLDEDTLYRLASQTADPTDRILAIAEYQRQDGSEAEPEEEDTAASPETPADAEAAAGNTVEAAE